MAGFTSRGNTIPYTAGAAVSAYTAVKYGAADGTVIQATAATDSIIGLATDIDSASGARCDVFENGCIAEGIAAGNITRGAAVTANADGHLVAASAAGQRILGFAKVSAVDNDRFPVSICPGFYSVTA